VRAKKVSGKHSIEPSPTSQLWRPVNGFSLHWRLWDDQYVVYNAGSSHTHILDPVAALIIQNLTKGPLETGALIQQIANLLGLKATSEVRDKLRLTLRNLDELGLLEAVPA
jgi:PqqD family protein of HPr-rel-A system